MALSDCNVHTDPQKKELVKHGTPLFPIACYEDNFVECPVPWHWHDELEYIVATKGVCEISVTDSKITLYPGQGVFINSGVLHASGKQSGETAIVHSFVFHPKLIGGNTDSIFWQKLIAPCLQNKETQFILFDTSTDWGRMIVNAFHLTWDSIVNEADDHENLARYQLSRIQSGVNAHFVYTHPKDSMRNILYSEHIKTMLSYIEQHYFEDISLEELSESASISESSCLRCFKKILGISPIQYLKEYRIEKAAELLITTDLKINEVGTQCGFNDISYFTKSFREQKGITPKDYRNTPNINTLRS